jgi:hypothetical protein
MNNNKEIIQSNIAGLNPTGILNYDGTFNLNGPNNIVHNSQNASKENLNIINNNKVVCSNIENFQNFQKFENNIYIKKNNLLVLILILLIFSFLILFSY